VAHVHPLLATRRRSSRARLRGRPGILHTRFKINGLLSGILVMTAIP
jgi:ABC-type uncharacterized transport system permease subunit